MSDEKNPILTLSGDIDVALRQGSVPVDDALNEESTNPVQNCVITKALKNIKQSNPDDELSEDSTNCVQNRIITQALKSKKEIDLDESISSNDILKLFS